MRNTSTISAMSRTAAAKASRQSVPWSGASMPTNTVSPRPIRAGSTIATRP